MSRPDGDLRLHLQALVRDGGDAWPKRVQEVRTAMTGVSLGPYAYPVDLVLQDRGLRELIRSAKAGEAEAVKRIGLEIVWRLFEVQGLRSDTATRAVNLVLTASGFPLHELTVDPNAGPPPPSQAWSDLQLRVAKVGIAIAMVILVLGTGLKIWELKRQADIVEALKFIEDGSIPVRDRFRLAEVRKVAHETLVATAIDRMTSAYSQEALEAFRRQLADTPIDSPSWVALLSTVPARLGDELLNRQARAALQAEHDQALAKRDKQFTARVAIMFPSDDANENSWLSALAAVDSMLTLPLLSEATRESIRSIRDQILGKRSDRIVAAQAASMPSADATLATWDATVHTLRVASKERQLTLTEKGKYDLNTLLEQALTKRSDRIIADQTASMPSPDAPLAVWDAKVTALRAATKEHQPTLTEKGKADLTALQDVALLRRGGAVIQQAHVLNQQPEGLDLDGATDRWLQVTGLAADPLLSHEQRQQVEALCSQVNEKRGASVLRILMKARPVERPGSNYFDEVTGYLDQCRSAAALPSLSATTTSRISHLVTEGLSLVKPRPDMALAMQATYLRLLNQVSEDTTLPAQAKEKVRTMLSAWATPLEERLRSDLSKRIPAEQVYHPEPWNQLFASATIYVQLGPKFQKEAYQKFCMEVIRFHNFWFVRRARSITIRDVFIKGSSKWSRTFGRPDIRLSILVNEVTVASKLVRSVRDDILTPIDFSVNTEWSWGDSLLVRVEDDDGHACDFKPLPVLESEPLVRINGDQGLTVRMAVARSSVPLPTYPVP